MEGSMIPEGVRCVYEVIVGALRPQDLNMAMKVGIESATTVHGVRKITAANYGGTLGKGKIYLQNLFGSET
jgi:formylmethanofuran--tetrahydromethanopterin N-formyltransferase